MATKLITVTKTGIRKGHQGDIFSCPIARACVAVGLKNVTVDGTEVEGTYHGETFNATLPKRAQKFVERFDNDKKSVKPFSFLLRLLFD